MATRGGKREGAGRKPSLVIKDRVTITIPVKYKKEIRQKVKKLLKAYEERCKSEL